MKAVCYWVCHEIIVIEGRLDLLDKIGSFFRQVQAANAQGPPDIMVVVSRYVEAERLAALFPSFVAFFLRFFGRTDGEFGKPHVYGARATMAEENQSIELVLQIMLYVISNIIQCRIYGAAHRDTQIRLRPGT